jgi:hypothetical protein
MNVKSDLVYARKLVEAGVNGVATAWEKAGDRPLEPMTGSAVWMPAGIGAAAGLLSVCLNRNRRSASSLAAFGLLGSVLGFGAAVAWASRDFSGTAVRTARHKVNTLRDARWLEHHPIDYA